MRTDSKVLSNWHTFEEIQSQPQVWKQWVAELLPQLDAIQQWLATSEHDTVWFCGAGTSAYIGEGLASHLNGRTGRARYKAVPTTDVVSQPQVALAHVGKLLVVSFGRSGNSSESIGTLDALDALAPQADRLHITCNRDGVLAQRAAPGPGVQKSIVLPPQTDDRGFAMTSSFTTMYLTALAVFETDAKKTLTQTFHALSDAADVLLDVVQAEAPLKKTIPKRAVFLGSGPLTAAARESALKVLELTAGKVATQWDSCLGFRHGPKAFIDTDTQIYIFVSADPTTQRYDLDVVAEIQQQFGVDAVCAIGPASTHCVVPVPSVRSDAWSTPLYVICAQMLAVTWSHAMGLCVDNPFSNGNLTRVVSGVTLYPVTANA